MLRRAIRKRLVNGRTAEEERKEPRVLLNVAERLDIGEKINLRIFFAFGPELETIKVNSRVVWVDRVENEGSYRSGVKFLDLSAPDRKRLGRFFEKF